MTQYYSNSDLPSVLMEARDQCERDLQLFECEDDGAGQITCAAPEKAQKKKKHHMGWLTKVLIAAAVLLLLWWLVAEMTKPKPTARDRVRQQLEDYREQLRRTGREDLHNFAASLGSQLERANLSSEELANLGNKIKSAAAQASSNVKQAVTPSYGYSRR